MAAKATTTATIKKNTVADMIRAGTYKPEYDPIIEIYAELREQYEIITKKFVKSKYQFEVDTGAGGMKKAPIVATLESLRKDILAYSDRLCLNPKSIDSIDIKQPKRSALVLALTESRDTG